MADSTSGFLNLIFMAFLPFRAVAFDRTLSPCLIRRALRRFFDGVLANAHSLLMESGLVLTRVPSL